MKIKLQRIAVATLALSGFAFAHGQNLLLIVKHSSTSSGIDGVKRSNEFAERITRSADTVWISRVMPTDSDALHAHAKGGDQHKHLDVATSTRWITRDSGKTVLMRLVPHREKVVVIVTKADYGNIGFDGSWAAAWSLIDPAAFKSMKVESTAGDLTTYTTTKNGRNVKVIWNTKLQIPTLVQSWDKNSRNETVVQIATAPVGFPWEKTQGYFEKDYSDYLD